MRFPTLALAGMLVLGSPALADDASQLANWVAAPYWNPPSASEEAGGPAPAAGRTPEAGRQPLAAGPTALPFIALPPCRIVDTRGNAPLTGGFLPPATTRSYTVTNVCGIPPGAQALSLNATVVNPTGPGFLVLWAQGAALPTVSTLNFTAGAVVANAAVVPLSGAGGVSLALGVSGGDVILDTNGYYAPVSTVRSLNTLGGDVVIAAGSNVTLTPSGQALTISASGAQGPTGPTGPPGPPGPTGWALTGNAGTTPGTNFIGTTDNQALELKVNGQRAARFEPAALPNVVLGDGWNSVLYGAKAATISGGGTRSLYGNSENIVTGDGGTVGGGAANRAGDGDANPNTGTYGTVGGGYGNSGFGNFSTVAGGEANVAIGALSMVPGGYRNQAGGSVSFAAGYGATVRDPVQSGTPEGDYGTFVWADGQGSDVVSTGPNQFLIRAGGGVGINTTSPGYPLEVSSAGDTQVGLRSATTGGRVWTVQSSSGQAGGILAGSFQIVDRTAGQARLAITSVGQVAINATDPLGFTFAVNGTAGKPGGGSWSLYSDARLKRDIRPLQGTLDRLLALRGVTFEYVDPEAVHELPGTRIGMVAQEVETVFPDWVSEGPDGYRRLTIRGFEALTVEALRDLRREKDDEIGALKSSLERQRAEIAALRAEIDRVRAERAEARVGRKP